MKWESIVFLKKIVWPPYPPPHFLWGGGGGGGGVFFSTNFENSTKGEENMKWEKNKFNISKIHTKFKQHPINIKNYTAHHHDMLHIPAKFREYTAMRLWISVKTKRDGQRQTDGGHFNIWPGPSAQREKKKKLIIQGPMSSVYHTC